MTIYRPEDEILSGIRKNGGFVNAHAHFDRAFSLTSQSYDLSRLSLAEKWDLVDDLKITSTVDDIYDRMAMAIEHMIEQGVQAVGSFIDVDPVIKDKAIRAADRVRNEYKNDIQLVFINQVLKGVIEPQAYEWFREGAQFADIIGGLPKRDPGREKEHIDIIIQTAKSMGKRVHAHVDQYNDPRENETKLLADRARAHGMEGMVEAVHALSPAAKSLPRRQVVYRSAKRAGLGIIACASAWIDSRRNETLTVTHNSIAPVEELLKEGIRVSMGTDNIYDVYKPFSNGKMEDELRLLVDVCGLRDKEQIIKIATENGLKALGLPTKGDIFVGCNGTHSAS